MGNTVSKGEEGYILIVQLVNILFAGLVIFLTACSSQPEQSLEEGALLDEDNRVYVFTEDTEAEAHLELNLPLQGPPSSTWVEDSRRYVSGVVGGVASAVDSYISEDDRVVHNKSYVRLRMGETWQNGGNFIRKSDIKLKVDFPKSKDRVGIVFDTSPEEFESLEQQNRISGTGDQLIQDQGSATAALRFVWNGWNAWQPSLDAGIKGASPVNPFVRFRFSKSFAISPQWRLLSNNELYTYYQDGFSEQSSLSFIRPIGESVFFVNKQEVRWVHDRRLLNFANISSFTHAYDERKVFTYRAGAFYEEKPDPHLTSYFIDFSYRHRLHEDWLYVELIPSLTWPEDEDFNKVAELTLRFELYFRN